MSGEHQRQIWSLPAPTGSVSYYDRMKIAVGRANSTSVSTDHDTLLKALHQYLVDHDSWLKVFSSAVVTSISGDPSGRINAAPMGVHKKKKLEYDELIELPKLNMKDSKPKHVHPVKIRVEAIVENKLQVNFVEFLSEGETVAIKLIEVEEN